MNGRGNPQLNVVSETGRVSRILYSQKFDVGVWGAYTVLREVKLSLCLAKYRAMKTYPVLN